MLNKLHDRSLPADAKRRRPALLGRTAVTLAAFLFVAGWGSRTPLLGDTTEIVNPPFSFAQVHPDFYEQSGTTTYGNPNLSGNESAVRLSPGHASAGAFHLESYALGLAGGRTAALGVSVVGYEVSDPHNPTAPGGVVDMNLNAFADGGQHGIARWSIYVEKPADMIISPKVVTTDQGTVGTTGPALFAGTPAIFEAEGVDNAFGPPDRHVAIIANTGINERREGVSDLTGGFTFVAPIGEVFWIGLTAGGSFGAFGGIDPELRPDPSNPDLVIQTFAPDNLHPGPLLDAQDLAIFNDEGLDSTRLAGTNFIPEPAAGTAALLGCAAIVGRRRQ